MTNHSICFLFLFGLITILCVSDVSEATVLKEETKLTLASTSNSSPLSISSRQQFTFKPKCNKLPFQEIIACVCWLRFKNAIRRTANWKSQCFCTKSKFRRPCMDDENQARRFCTSLGAPSVELAKKVLNIVANKCGAKPEKFI